MEREKSGTAEDQNAMFARLAGKSGDRDLDVDDMFVDRGTAKMVLSHEGEAVESQDQGLFKEVGQREISVATDRSYQALGRIRDVLRVAEAADFAGVAEGYWEGECRLLDRTC